LLNHRILDCLLKYLSNESGPGLEVFKLQCLSTQCNSIITTKHGSYPGMFELNYQRDQFIDLMSSFKIQRGCSNTSEMEGLYNNSEFGGSLIENRSRVMN
jgi:hypothetical protein